MKPKLLVVAGPTASGKTALAVEAAERFDGEVVSADSRQIYRGMDIGTGKATEEERGGVPHHLLDVVAPDETLTLAEYKRKALEAITDTQARGKLPILVGGTGLYVQAVVENLEIPEVPPDEALRGELAELPPEELLRRLRASDAAYAERIGPNPRYAIRALEVMRATGKTMTELQKRGEQEFDALQIGLDVPDDELKARISARADLMLEQGLLEEVKRLRERYPDTLPAMSGIGYRELSAYLKGETSLSEALQAMKRHTWRYARRQKTWFRRDERILWFKEKKAALEAVEKWLK